MSSAKTTTITKQNDITRVTLKPKQSVLATESETTEKFYTNALQRCQSVLDDQERDIYETKKKLQITEKALRITQDENRKELERKANEIKDREMKLKLMEQELEM